MTPRHQQPHLEHPGPGTPSDQVGGVRERVDPTPQCPVLAKPRLRPSRMMSVATSVTLGPSKCICASPFLVSVSPSCPELPGIPPPPGKHLYPCPAANQPQGDVWAAESGVVVIGTMVWASRSASPWQHSPGPRRAQSPGAIAVLPAFVSPCRERTDRWGKVVPRFGGPCVWSPPPPAPAGC